MDIPALGELLPLAWNRTVAVASSPWYATEVKFTSMERRSERFARYALMPCLTASLLSMFFLQPPSRATVRPSARAGIDGSFTLRLYRTVGGKQHNRAMKTFWRGGLVIVGAGMLAQAAAADAAAQYNLPPDKLQQAIEYAHARYALHFAGAIWGIAVLVAILAFGLAGKYRDWAVNVSKRRVAQAAVFVVLFGLTNDVLSLPLGVYGQH